MKGQTEWIAELVKARAKWTGGRLVANEVREMEAIAGAGVAAADRAVERLAFELEALCFSVYRNCERGSAAYDLAQRIMREDDPTGGQAFLAGQLEQARRDAER